MNMGKLREAGISHCPKHLSTLYCVSGLNTHRAPSKMAILSLPVTSVMKEYSIPAFLPSHRLLAAACYQLVHLTVADCLHHARRGREHGNITASSGYREHSEIGTVMRVIGRRAASIILGKNRLIDIGIALYPAVGTEFTVNRRLQEGRALLCQGRCHCHDKYCG